MTRRLEIFITSEADNDADMWADFYDGIKEFATYAMEKDTQGSGIYYTYQIRQSK